MAEEVTWIDQVLRFAPIVIGVGGLLIGYWQYRKALKARLKELERSEIYKKLNEFYGPLLQLRKKSKLIYDQFKAVQKAEDPSFNTLVHLLENKSITKNQKALLAEILLVGKECEDLIREKAGLIDDETLRTVTIPQFVTHLLIIRLAYSGGLKGESEKYKKHSFPKDLDSQLETRFDALTSRLDDLNNV